MTTDVGEEFRAKPTRVLPAEKVRELSQLSAWRATWSLVKTWSLLVGMIWAAVRWPRWWMVAIAMVVVAAGQHGLAVLVHESAHHRMYKTRWWNDLAGKLCAWPMGLSMLSYRIIHRMHHNHLYEDVDPDLALIAGYPRGRMYLAKRLLRDLFGLTTVKNVQYFMGSTVRRDRKDDTSPRLQRAARRDRWIAAGIYFGMLAAGVATGTWRWLLLLWVIPLVTLLQVILRLRAVCEHGAVTDLSTPLRAARTTLAPRALRWLMFPHQVFYHVEHHLYPSVPHYRLPDCHRALRGAGILADAEVVTLGVAMRKVFAERAAAEAALGDAS
jgi:fatty acid desaturase